MSREAEQQPPSYEEFDVLKEVFLGIASETEAQVKRVGDDGLWMKVERLYADYDEWSWPLTEIRLTGLIKTVGNGNKLRIRYRELPHHAGTVNSSVNHDYMMDTSDEEVVWASQNIIGCPQVEPAPPNLRLDLVDAKEAVFGDMILRRELGMGIRLTAGDCGVLFDRMMFLMG